MAEEPYTNRELDGIHERIEGKVDQVLEQVTFTNGKLRKIIIVMILIAGIVIGQLFTGGEIVKTLIAIAL